MADWTERRSFLGRLEEAARLAKFSGVELGSREGLEVEAMRRPARLRCGGEISERRTADAGSRWTIKPTVRATR